MKSSQLLKGVLEVAVLATISRREVYGLELLELLRKAGITPLGDPSVYGVLRRLEQDELVTARLVPSTAGPARKYYAITPKGCTSLDAAEAEWSRLAQAVNLLLEMRREDG
ncbi:PadR family transcriptional regulator [Micromonospora sp. WMMD1082]|uniref:PadR family transcriptional regulator n=1 Tax=Micromonospora sp. WMMD1082 TaxID=3016104 RepID=UPI002416C504|nr:PadR family transcriptional regulator [Micromonospora sp. WMMD1082]MDG4793299.1 PadR family transcriptional regulator [Micromonospora sp. WMMD1082]